MAATTLWQSGTRRPGEDPRHPGPTAARASTRPPRMVAAAGLLRHDGPARGQRVLYASAARPQSGPNVKPAPVSVDAADVEALFDSIPDVLFFIKDREGRYTHVNATMLRRLDLRARREIIGRTASEVYPGDLSANYGIQDQQVLAGAVIDNLLELHLFSDQEPGWCLTAKRPLRVDGQIAGLIGISRDLASREGLQSDYLSLREALLHMNQHYADNIRIQDLLAITGFSESKLERTFQKVFQLSPLQLLTRIRIQAAMHRLQGTGSIAEIAQACGFGDQSAFTRRFVAIVGSTPRDYRRLRAP